MASNVLNHYNLNPYKPSNVKQTVVILAPPNYYTSLFIILTPIALRVILALAGKLTAEEFAVASLDELAGCVQTSRGHVNKGLLQLVKYNLIRKKRRGEYWINPKVFRPAIVEIVDV